MPLVAVASKTVRNKNIILVLLCAGFAVWFGYDGFIGWPKANDTMVVAARTSTRLNPDDRKTLEGWHGQAVSTPKQRVDVEKVIHGLGGEFHKDSDLLVQKLIVTGLVLATLGAIIYALGCQKRRAVLDVEAKTLSPKPGLTIAVDAITKIDNTRWKKTGIVDLTYTTSSGGTATTELDDYKLDGLPPLLNELSTLAEKAEIVVPDAPV